MLVCWRGCDLWDTTASFSASLQSSKAQEFQEVSKWRGDVLLWSDTKLPSRGKNHVLEVFWSKRNPSDEGFRTQVEEGQFQERAESFPKLRGDILLTPRQEVVKTHIRYVTRTVDGYQLSDYWMNVALHAWLENSRAFVTLYLTMFPYVSCQSSFFHSERYQEPGNAVARIAAIVAGFQQQNTDAASRVLPHLITLSSLTGWWVDTHLICLYFILLYCNNSSDNNTTNYFTCAALFILQMPQSLIKKNKQMKWENRTAAKGSSAQTNLSW